MERFFHAAQSLKSPFFLSLFIFSFALYFVKPGRL